MTFRAALRLLPGLGLAAWLWAGPACPPAAAQGKSLSLADEATLNSFTGDKKITFETLVRGETQFVAKTHLAVVSLAAKFYVQRVASLAQKTDTKTLRGYVADFESVVDRAKPTPGAKPDPKKKDFQSAFATELIKSFEAVLSQDPKTYQANVLHAAFMLEPFGRLGQPQVGDFLAGLVKDKGRQEFVKLFALKGLREYFLARPPKVFSFTANPERDREAKRLEAVLDFLQRPAPNASDEEVAAFVFIRREAVKALAASGIPAIPMLESKGLRAPVARGLARVLSDGKDTLSPPGSPAERLEAALGLCRMRADTPPDVNGDLVAALVGKALVEFGQQYKNDEENFVKGSRSTRLPPKLPWKAYAERMKVALKDLERNLPAGAKDARQRAAALDKAATPVLDTMRYHKELRGPLGDLQAAVKAMPQPPSAVYAGTKEPTIDIGPWPPAEG
jgi:hypothetical protein